MTTAPEAFLALEAEIAYATMAHITDYDVWHVSEEPVTVEMVIKTLNKNVEIAQAAIANAVEHLDEDAEYACHNALQNAIMTAPDKMSKSMLEKLRPLVGRYFE
jgi:5'-methylthioadenosine phosphorylase